jgi:hypothetical protein
MGCLCKFLYGVEIRLRLYLCALVVIIIIFLFVFVFFFLCVFLDVIAAMIVGVNAIYFCILYIE